jgi:hypothetical protein
MLPGEFGAVDAANRAGAENDDTHTGAAIMPPRSRDC